MSKSRKALQRDLAEPAPIPAAGIERAVELMQSGRTFRYGEFGGESSEVAKLEEAFAAYVGRKYALALNSCGSAMFVALKCAGVQHGDQVLLNGFTLAPVPGAIVHAGAQPVLVECDSNYHVDLEDLEAKASCGATVLMLSHMRGHIANMDRVCEICNEHGLTMIEDCAHTMGARWNGRISGSFGASACFSTQALKHMNSGEGGLLVTDDEHVAAQAILYSGSYMLYSQHGARPSLEVFEQYVRRIPNFSLRMSELAAAIVRPQIAELGTRAACWNERYDLLAGLFRAVEHVQVPKREPREQYVACSIQFTLTGLSGEQIERVLKSCRDRGVDIKWFGQSEPVGFTSAPHHWRYLDGNQPLPRTHAMLNALCDMRIPLTLEPGECRLIASILSDAIGCIQ